MHRASVHRVLTFVLLALLAPAAWASDALRFFNNWFVTGDYVVGGVGLRAKGVSGWATGDINITGMPAGAEPVAAFLYWSTVEPTTTPAARVGYFKGFKIQGTVLGNPQSPNLPCYSSGGNLGLPGTAGQVYRADVLRYLPVDKNNVRQANGKHTVKLPDSGGNGNGELLYTDGASLVVIYKVVIPGSPAAVPLRAVVIYNGAYSMDKHSSGMTQNVAGFYQASASAAAKITNIVANGQSGFSSPLSVNGTTLNSSPFVGAQGTRWDNPTYNFNLAKDAFSFSALTTVGGNQVCVTWAAMVASMNVQDTDRDGLLDVWETKGLHRNTTVSPATFGGCSDNPSEPCVALQNMGANPNRQDIYLQMDWMHGTGDGSGGIDGHGIHDHLPKLGALSAVAATFAPRGINLHFDVGNNYQGPQSACGNVACSFIVPASNAKGGSDLDESTLVCHNTATHTCDYQQPYPVLSFEFGFASVRDGNRLLNISPHFPQNRKDIFHYALFAHALGGPYNINGQPVDPTTNLPTTVPRSYSGIAHRPGGGFMVTFGLWRSDLPGDDQVGSPLAQAGTIMHELGHNLGLAHAGLSTQPNCMPNYQSVMNYLYQTRGLTDPFGEHVDFSFGILPVLKEKALPAGALTGQKYAIRFFGPVGPGTPPGSAAQLHCDGTPITDGASEVRLEGPSVPLGTPDWSNGKVNPPPPDVNFDGITTGSFADQPDWTSLNLQQIGTGYNFGGLSLGALATDGGAYATDGGALATDAGALATDGGVFATDGGAFATDGGAFATDGGVFATDGGALATDGGALATDAGDLDQTTLILSSSAGPPTGLTATNTISSIQLAWLPPDGVSQSYNIFRCAGVGCTPNASAPAFGNVVGGTATPNFTDAVNDFIHAGASCPSGSTCYNTFYTYAVTSRAMVNSSVVESGFSQPLATSEVTHLFVIADTQNVVYGATPTPTFQVYGDGPGLAANSVSCVYTPAVARNAGPYSIACSGPATSSPTDGVTYNQPYLTFTPGTLTITQRPITVTAVTSSKKYDGTTISTATPTITLGTLVFGDTATWTETYDDKNVGSTHVMTPSGTISDQNNGANYNVTFVKFNAGVINKADATVIVTPYSVTYDGNAHTATVASITGVNGEAGATVGTVTLPLAHTNAGTYAADSWSFTGTGNYNNIASMTITDVINKANATVVVTPYTTTYDGGSHTATVTSITGVNGETGATVGTVNVSNTTHTNAGTFATDSWSFTGAANYNNTASTTITDTINKANATVVVTPYTATYTGLPQSATVTSITGVNGETGATVGAVNLSNTAHTNAGNYASDSWSFTGAANYNNIAITTITDIINKANATVVVTPYTAAYTGQPHSAAITSITGVNGESWATVGTVDVSNTTHSNAGTYSSDSWSFTGANYNSIGPTTITDTINKANASVVVTPYNIGFDGNSHTATITSITGVNGEGGATVGSVALSSTHTNAGTYAGDYWSFTGAANYNNIGNTTITDTIGRATATILVTPYHVTYDGNAHAAGGSATGVGGVSLNAGLALTGTVHANAGTYSVDPWAFSGAPNYYDAVGTVNDIIDPADAVVIVTPYNVGYDGSPHTATVTSITGVNGETAANVGTVDVSGTTHTTEGDYPADPWTFTPAVPGNYKNTSGTTHDIIGSAPPHITAGPVTGFKNYTYPATLLAATGGAPPYTWSGASIAGMNLTTGGILTGLPTADGTATVTVTDSNGVSTSTTFTIVGPTSVQGAGGPSVTTISNINLTAGPVNIQQITTTPGAPLTVRLDYSLVEGVGYCPGCIDQLVVAFVNTLPTVCPYDGQPGPGGTSGSAAVNLIAPSLPGRYYVAYHKHQQYTCGAALQVLSPSDPVIGVVDVIPNTSVTWHAVTVTGIAVAPAQVSPGGSITATFSWNAPVSGTIGFGFNTDPAMTQCGALNYGAAAPTFTAPSQPGRYYLSIDNPNTCVPNPTPWQSGVPAADFARYIGVVDVQ